MANIINRFDRATAIRQEQNLKRLSKPGLAQPKPEGGFSAGFQVTNDVAIGMRAYEALSAERGEWDETFRPIQYMRDTGGYDDILENAKLDAGLQDTLSQVRNVDDMNRIIGLYRDSQERMSAMMQGGWSGAAGAVLGAVLSPTNLIPGATAWQLGKTTYKSMQAARAANALKGAAIEGGINAGLVALEGVSDPAVDGDEIFLGAALGAVLGAGIGGLVKPKINAETAEFISRASKKARFDRVAAVENEAKSVGAAASAELRATDFQYSPHMPDPNESITFAQRMENYLGVNGLFNVIRGGTQRFHQLNLELGKTPAFQELARLWSKIATPSTPTIGEEFTDLARQTNIHSYNQRVNALQQEALNEVATARAQINEALGDLTRLTKRRSWIQRGDGSFRSTRGAITDDEILFLVNWTMRRMDELEGESLAEAAEKVISHFVGDAVKGEKIAESLSLNIQAAVKRYHKVFNLVGKEAKRTGVDVNDLIDEDKLARGMYVPRRWIDDATIEHRAALEDIIANEIRAGGLQDEQLQAVREALIGDMGKADFEQQFPELADPNVNFADLPEEVQLDLEDFWREITATDAQVELARREIELEKALKADLTAGKEVLLRAEVAKYQKLLKKSETLRKKLDKAKGGEKVKTRNLLFKNDQEIEKQARKLKTLNDHYRSRDAVLKSLNEMKRKGGKKGTEAAKLAKKIEGKQERAASIKRRLNDRQGIIDNLTPSKLAKKMLRNLNNKKLHGDTDVGLDIMFEPGDASAMKARQLPLARAVDEFDPRLNDLMSNDLNQTMRTYVDQVGTRNFWADEFGDMNPMEVINKHLEDIDPKYHGEIQKLFEHLFNRQLGIHSLKGTGASRFMRWFSSNMRQYNVAAYLGSAGLMLPGDVGLLHMAGEVPNVTRMGKQMAGLFRFGANSARGAVDNLALLGDNRKRLLLMGLDNAVNYSSRQQKILELDPLGAPRGVGRPGSRIYHASTMISEGARKASEWMMTLNGMNFWNNNMDYAFRFLHMGDLLEMSKKSWDELPDAYRMRMQGTGVGKAQWSKIQKIHDQKRLTTWKGPYGDVTLPDPDKMGPDELALYKLSLDGYSSHGIIHPEFGDVPLYSDDPVGAMMFQFQGFAYAAQQKLARKLMKKGIQDPLTLQTLMAFGMFGVLSSLVRSTMYGEGEEWFESWTTPEGAIERTYELMVRSPLAVGASGMIGDLLMHSLQPINTITGTNLIPGASRRRQQDTIDIIGGPGVASINRFGKAVPGILGGIAEGSPGDVYDASKNILPFTSHIGVRALESALGDD